LNQKYKLLFGHNLELRIKKKNKNGDSTRFEPMEPMTSCSIGKHLTRSATAFTGKQATARRCYDNQVVRREFFCAKNGIQLGVKMVEFSDGVSFSGFPHSQSMFYTLMVYSSTKGQFVVGVFMRLVF
jgi:hypothetical protein